jgi:ribosomal protein L7Ae-like RNA K-turn-binding protein
MDKKDQAVLQMLGLATKAGKTVTGYENCKNAIKSGKAKMVIIAQDASVSTIQPLIDLCGYHKVRYDIMADKEKIGIFTGKQNRAVAVVTDRNLALALTGLRDAT